MPRNGQGVYSLPPVYEAVTGETIEAQQHNVPLEDLAADANNARPVSTGGTGAQSATQARENLNVYSKSEVDEIIPNSAVKSTLADNDGFVIADSAENGKPKRVLWSRFKILVADYINSLQSFVRRDGTLSMTGNLRVSKTDPRIILVSQSGARGYEINANVSDSDDFGLRFLSGSTIHFTINSSSLATFRSGVNVGTTLTAGGKLTVSAGGAEITGNAYVYGGFLEAENGLVSGGNIRARNGNVYIGNDNNNYLGAGANLVGSTWGGGSLSSWLATQIATINATIETRSYQRTQDFLVNQGPGTLGSYAFLYYRGSSIIYAGTAVAASELNYSSAWGNAAAPQPPNGSYYCMGHCDSSSQTGRATLFLRRA